MNDDRRTYLGGPGAATILGLSSFETPLSLWQRLTNRAEPVQVNDAMRSGMRLERAVLDFAAEELHQNVLPGPFLRDPLFPLGGHLDGVTEDGSVVEAKTSRSKRDWGEPGTGEVPVAYAAQALHYLGLKADAAVCWMPVLFSGLDFALYRIERDDATIQAMRQICSAWWETHVVGDVPPPPVSGADALRLFPRDSGGMVVADDSVVAAVERLRDVRKQVAELEAARDELEGKIKCAMGNAAVLTINGEQAVTWRATKPAHRFNVTTFRGAHPDLYEQYCELATSRRFLVK